MDAEGQPSPAHVPRTGTGTGTGTDSGTGTDTGTDTGTGTGPAGTPPGCEHLDEDAEALEDPVHAGDARHQREHHQRDQ